MKWTFGRVRNEHPSPSALLLAIEGELSAKEELAVNQHLQKCWECRAQSEKLREGILQYMAYHDDLSKNMDPPPAGWAGFPYRLHSVAAECLQHTKQVRLVSFVALARALAIAAVLVLAAYLTVSRLVHPPAVSANEVLRLAAKARRAEWERGPHGPARQRLLIRHGGRSLTREVVRGANQAVQPADSATSDEQDLQRVFTGSGLNWRDPLDPEAFAHWRSSLAAKQDRVQTAGNQLTLTTVGSGPFPVLEASLTLRTADWHPLSEQLRLADQSRVDITELPAEDGSAVAAVASPETRSSDVETPVEPKTVSNEVTIGTADLEKSELQARVALHTIRADLGEQIEIRRDNATVIVKGLANTSERKHQIETALAGISDVSIAVRSIAEISPGRSRTPATSLTLNSAQQPPLLRDRLFQVFPDETERQHFVDRTLARSQAALMRAWAVRRLAERYTPEESAHLDSGSREALRELLNDNLTAMHGELGDLRSSWGALLPLGEAVAPPPQQSPADWQTRALQLFPAVESVDQLSTWALAGVDGPGLEPGEMLRKLASQLNDAQFWLDRLTAQMASLEGEQRHP